MYRDHLIDVLDSVSYNLVEILYGDQVRSFLLVGLGKIIQSYYRKSDLGLFDSDSLVDGVKLLEEWLVVRDHVLLLEVGQGWESAIDVSGWELQEIVGLLVRVAFVFFEKTCGFSF